MATHSSILAWKIPWSLVGYSPWSLKESDMTEGLSVPGALYRIVYYLIFKSGL